MNEELPDSQPMVDIPLPPIQVEGSLETTPQQDHASSQWCCVNSWCFEFIFGYTRV